MIRKPAPLLADSSRVFVLATRKIFLVCPSLCVSPPPPQFKTETIWTAKAHWILFLNPELLRSLIPTD